MKIIKIIFIVIIVLIVLSLGLTVMLTLLALIGIYLGIVGLIAMYLDNYGSVVRRKGSTLFMPIVEFYHKTSKKRVSFLGCMHIGDASYYKTLEHYIQLHPSALIMCEGTPDLFNLSQEEIAKKDYALIASLIGGVSQYVMPYQPEWVFNDLPQEQMKRLAELIKRLHKSKDGKSLRETIATMKPKEKTYTGKVISYVLLHTNFLKTLFFFRRKKHREKVVFHHILHVRNKVAVEALDKELPNHGLYYYGVLGTSQV